MKVLFLLRSTYLFDRLGIMLLSSLLKKDGHQVFLIISENLKDIEIYEKVMVVNPDVIALDFRPGQNPNNYWPMHESNMKELAKTLLNDEKYTVIYEEPHRYIFVKKNYPYFK